MLALSSRPRTPPLASLRPWLLGVARAACDCICAVLPQKFSSFLPQFRTCIPAVVLQDSCNMHPEVWIYGIMLELCICISSNL